MNDSVRDPLRLSELPQPDPPRDGWPDVAAALHRQRRRRRLVSGSLAAVLLLSAVLAWHRAARDTLTGPAAGAHTPPSLATGTTDRNATAAGGASRPATGAHPTSLAALIGLSQRLEVRLRRLRDEAGALPAGAVAFQVELEDLVAQVDEELSRRPDSAALWARRVNLLLDLDQLYRQSLRREPGRFASL